MIRKYWKAESYMQGNLESKDFPYRETKDEAIKDAQSFLSDLVSDFDKRHRTAAVVAWAEDEDGGAVNIGEYEAVSL